MFFPAVFSIFAVDEKLFQVSIEWIAKLQEAYQKNMKGTSEQLKNSDLEGNNLCLEANEIFLTYIVQILQLDLSAFF